MRETLRRIANSLSASAGSENGAVLYSWQIGGAKSEFSAVQIAKSNNLAIINDTQRAKFLLAKSAGQDVPIVEQKLAQIYTKLYPDALPQKIARLVENALYGGNSGSLWGDASSEFASTIKGKVIILTQNPSNAGVFFNVEAAGVAENTAVTTINDVAITAADRTVAGIISLSKSTFTSALAHGGVFATSASAAKADGVAIASETLAKLGASTAGAKTAAELSAEGLVNLTAGVLETAAADVAETFLAAGGARLLGLLGLGLGSPWVAALTAVWSIMSPSKAYGAELETLANQTEASLSEDTPSVIGGHVSTYSNGTSAVDVPLSNASGTQNDQYVFAENPTSQSVVLAVAAADDSKLLISSSINGSKAVDQQITDTTANGSYGDQITLNLSSTGVIDVGIAIEAGGEAEVKTDTSLSQVDDTFAFAGSSGTLKIDDPSTFTGTISGFVAGDIIDLASLGTTTSAFLNSYNLLTVQGSGGNASLQFDPSETYADDSFVFSSDGNGGTNIAGVSDSQDITLPSGNALLLVNDPAQFSGTISGFVPGGTRSTSRT